MTIPTLFHHRLTVLLSVVLLASACAPAQPAATAKPTSAPPAASPSPAPPTVAPPAASPAVSPAASPAPSPVAGPAWPGSLERAAETVVELLNASPANRADLGAILQRWDAPGGGPRSSVTEADLTGDGQPELVVGLVDPSAPPSPAGPRGLVIAIHTEGGRARSIPLATPTAPQGAAGPFVQRVVDADRNGSAEVLLQSQVCGASTCTLHPGVATWAGGSYRLLTPPELSMASGAAALEDRDNDGRLELILTGGQLGSAGAGPQRSRTEVYRLVGGRYELAETISEPTTSRYLTIVDANAAFSRRDFRAAEPLYQRAAMDAALTDDRPAGGNVGPGLRAFARFRLLLLNVLVGQDDDAREILERMQALDAATPYPAAAQVFWHTYGQTGSPEAACRQFAEAATRQPALLEPLTGWGYGNAEMKAEDLCEVP